MSRVYKQRQIVIGEEQIIELNITPVIKNRETQSLDLGETDSSDQLFDTEQEITESSEELLLQAKEEAELILANARIESERILHSANEEGQNLIAQAQNRAGEIEENARNKGYSEGFIKGREEGYDQVDALIQEAIDIKQNTLLEKKAVAKSLEGEIVELVISSIRKVIDHEVEKENQLLLNLVRKGIEKCVYTDSLIIRVSTENYEVVNSSKNKIYLMTEGIDHIEVKQDPALQSGSIIIETVSGTVEASIQTQIAQIESLFYDILKGE